MSKAYLVGVVCIAALLGATNGGAAADFECPAPNAINCVPAVKSIAGWTDNKGQKTGNSFAPNEQCANIIDLPGGKKRLVCCYTNCGVFTRDVQAKSCAKKGQSHFTCQ
jgi:hypothetical protein